MAMIKDCANCDECQYEYRKLIHTLLRMLVVWLPQNHPNWKMLWKGYLKFCKLLDKTPGKKRHRGERR